MYVSEVMLVCELSTLLQRSPTFIREGEYTRNVWVEAQDCRSANLKKKGKNKIGLKFLKVKILHLTTLYRNMFIHASTINKEPSPPCFTEQLYLSVIALFREEYDTRQTEKPYFLKYLILSPAPFLCFLSTGVKNIWVWRWRCS